jgi:hypothetical protein
MTMRNHKPHTATVAKIARARAIMAKGYRISEVAELLSRIIQGCGNSWGSWGI